MKEQRAYTEIGPAVAAIGNAGFERSWSAFIGCTMNLSLRPEGMEWLTGRASEFQIETGGRVLDQMALGYVEWSEECMPFGVALNALYQGDDWVFLTTTYAFHNAPGLYRACALMNRSPLPASIDCVRSELLPFKRCAVTTHELGVVAAARGQGLFLGVFEGHVEPLTTAPETWAAVAPGPHTLEPGESWKLPETYLVPFTGNFPDTQPPCGTLLREVRAMKLWQAQRMAEERAALEESRMDNQDGTYN